MDEEMFDMHVCLVCQSTVVGLLNYINHKKYDCQGRKITATVPTSGSSPQSQSPQSSSVPSNQVETQVVGTVTVLNEKTEDYVHPMGGLHLLASQCQPTTEQERDLASSGTSLNHSQANMSTDPCSMTSEPIPQNLMLQRSIPSQQNSITVGHNLGIEQNGLPNSNSTVSLSDQELAVVIDFSTEKSDIFSPSNGQGVDPNVVMTDATSKEKPDFFSSLALQSKSTTSKDSGHNEGMFGDQGHNSINELPIANILNSLNFSDDDLDFDEDFLEEAFSDESDGDFPPPEHTRGKWKPGEGPHHSTGGKWRSQRTLISTGGKWKPGMHKEGGGKGKGKQLKTRSTESASDYYCSTCDMSFKSRYIYSAHCGGKTHKKRRRSGKKMYEDEDETTVEEKEANADEQEEKNDEKEAEAASTENEQEKNAEESKENASVELTEVPVTIKPKKEIVEPECKICGQKFANLYVLTRHLLSKKHKNRTKGEKDTIRILDQYHKFIVRLSPFQCGLCQYYFNQENDLIAHLKEDVHRNQCKKLPGELMCTLCQYSSHSNEDLIYHMINNISHREAALKGRKLCIIKEKWFMAACKFCKKKMHSRVHMKRHVRSKHRKELNSVGHIIGESQIDEVGEFSCSECNNRKFKTYNAFVIHMNRRHGDSDAAICELCNKVLSGRNSFSQHMKSKKHKNKEMMRYLGKKEGKLEEVKEEKEGAVKEEEKEKEVKNEEMKNEQGEEEEGEEDKYTTLKYNTQKPDVPGMYERAHNNHHLKKPRGPYKKRGKKLTDKPVQEKIFKCNHCDYMVNKYADLRPHYMEAHSKEILVCELCDITFLNEKALKLHYSGKQHQANLATVEDNSTNVEGEPSIFHCHICNKRFTDEAWKQFHIDVYHLHPNSEELLVKELGRPDITWEKYKDFLETVKNCERNERIPCKECGKELKKDYMLEHLRLHSGDRPFKCRYCNLGFMSPLSLRRHLLTHLGLTERSCDICGKKYKKVESYREHMRQHAMEKQGVQKLMCDVCGMSFYLQRQLKHHMRRHGEKKFKCAVQDCHWSFYFANELDAHMKSHTKHRPFLCDQCGYSAGTKNRLLRHSRTHTGERNFHCEYCTYKAGTRTHLRRHMRIHIGSKPYKCPYCDYSCNTHENIRKHIMKTKKHEGLFIYPCKFCEWGSNTVNEFRAHSKLNHPEHYDDEKYEGIAAVMGLYVKEEDLQKPTEGMKINPVKERKPREASSQPPEKKIKAESMSQSVEEPIIVVPGYSQEEVVEHYGTVDYHIPYSGQNDTDISRPWNPTSQIETERAVRTVIVPSTSGETVITYEYETREITPNGPGIQGELYYTS
ncbi:zinc finger protein 26-like [Saccostrea echinata]|uniref:zinc finger protein 26-like n=1 Tax=Saccostrea echinata TaxID=191078 RepID=UPI002A7F80A6|nr:zinc finger protein 26-like [Saccostrea echinata]